MILFNIINEYLGIARALDKLTVDHINNIKKRTMTTKEKARKVYFLYSKYLHAAYCDGKEKEMEKIMTELEKYLK